MPRLWPFRTTANPPDARRRWQFRVATLLALPAVVALGLAWLGVGRKPRESYWGGFDGHVEWVRDRFDDSLDADRRDVPCFLKVSHLWQAPGAHGTSYTLPNFQNWSFSEEGEGKVQNRWCNGISSSGGSHPMPAGAMAAIRPILANMPPSDRDIPEEKSVAVGFRGPRGWETRVYDRRMPPPALAKALAAAGITLPP